jgi:hypothetical protein
MDAQKAAAPLGLIVMPQGTLVFQRTREEIPEVRDIRI